MHGQHLLLVFQEVPDILIYIVVEILHHLQAPLLIEPMYAYLMNPLTVGPDQAAIADPPPVIALHGLRSVPQEVNIQGIIPKSTIKGPRKPGKPVVGFDMLIGIIETVRT